MKKFIIIIVFLVFFTNYHQIYAEDIIPISISNKMDKLIFDGKWTHSLEWKRSSLNELYYPEYDKLIEFRSAHQDNFVYFLVDFVSDESAQPGKDSAIICMNTDNSNNGFFDENDYCFVSILNEKGYILRGNSTSNQLEKIEAIDGYIAISSMSDENDRYSKIPHTSFEFRIPTDLIGRNDIYGFYVGIYDEENQLTFSWPQSIKTNSLFDVPPPNQWGSLISPDKSLPEFDLPLLMLFVPFLTLFVLRKIKCLNFKQYQN